MNKPIHQPELGTRTSYSKSQQRLLIITCLSIFPLIYLLGRLLRQMLG